jgi:hypothetical protein
MNISALKHRLTNFRPIKLSESLNGEICVFCRLTMDPREIGKFSLIEIALIFVSFRQ